MFFFIFRKVNENKSQFNSKKVRFSSATDVETVQKSNDSDNSDNSKL